MSWEINGHGLGHKLTISKILVSASVWDAMLVKYDSDSVWKCSPRITRTEMYGKQMGEPSLIFKVHLKFYFQEHLKVP